MALEQHFDEEDNVIGTIESHGDSGDAEFVHGKEGLIGSGHRLPERDSLLEEYGEITMKIANENDPEKRTELEKKEQEIKEKLGLKEAA